MMLMMCLLLVSFASAFEFDNVKSYNPDTREVVITNAYGLGDEIGKAKLNTPLNVLVATGYQKVAEFDLWAYEDYNDALKQFTFSDMKRGKQKINKDYDLKYKTTEEILVDDYGIVGSFFDGNGTEVDEYGVVGQHKEDRVAWEKVTPANLMKNDYVTVGVFVFVEEGDFVDWIPTIYGVEVEEWATYEALYTETYTVSQYNVVNNGAGSSVSFVNNSYCQLTTSSTADGEQWATKSVPTEFDLPGDWTMNSTMDMLYGSGNGDGMLWGFGNTNDEYLDLDDFFGILVSHADTAGQANVYFQHRRNGVTDVYLSIADHMNDNLFPLDFEMVKTGTTISVTAWADTGAKIYEGSDTMNENWGDLVKYGMFGRDDFYAGRDIRVRASNFVYYQEFSDFGPNITLNSPSSTNYTSPQTIQFNFTAFDDINLTDVNLYVDDVLNQTNSSGINNTDYLFNLSLTEGDYIIHGQALDNKTGETNSSSVRIVIDSTPFIDFITPPTPVNYANISNESIPIYVNVSLGGNAIENISYDFYNFNGTLTQYQFTNETYLINVTLPDAHFHYNVTVCVDTGKCNSTETRHLNHDTTAPLVDIISPTGVYTYGFAGEIVDLNWTVSDNTDELDSCWYDYNGTTVAANCSANYTTFILEEGNYNITLYANDTFGNVNSSTSSWSYTLFSGGEIYSTSTTETALEYFEINISYDSSAWTSASAGFSYNDTSYDATVAGSGDDIVISYDLYVPTVNGTTVMDFFWTLNLTNASGTTSFSTTTKQQTVLKINFSVCNLSESPQLYFETYSTTSPEIAVNATFASAWEIKDVSGDTVALSRSYEDTSETNSTWGFCISPNSSNYTVSVAVTVDATGFTPTSHYIVNADYSGTGTPIPIYLLNDSDATLTQIVVRDQDNQPIEDVFTTIQRYDVGTDTYYNVAMTKSDSDGSDLTYLKWYDTWYRFIGVYNGEVVLTEGPEKISASPKTLSFGELSGSDYEKFRDISYSLTFNDDTDNYVLSFVDVSGETSSSCLRVIKRNVTADYLVCESCEVSSSATMYCNIAAWGNGTFIADYYATGSPRYYIDSLMELKNIQNEFYELIGNDNGTGMAIILAGIVLSMFLITPALGVLGAMLGMVLAISLGFQPMDYTAMIGIAVVGIAVMWAVQK